MTTHEPSPAPSFYPGRSNALGLLTSPHLRLVALVGVVAAALGRVVYPGLKGNASEVVVSWWERATLTFSYAFWLLLLVVVLRATYETGRLASIRPFTRVAAMTGAGLVVTLVFRALVGRLEAPLAVLVGTGATLTATAGAWSALHRPPTRAIGAALLLLAFSALLRLLAWEVGAAAGEHASLLLYDVGRGIATAAVILEGAGQLLGATWLGTRSRITGQLFASVAVTGAFLVTWGAARGAYGGAPLWQAVVHQGLLDAPGVPPPFKLSAFATFLVPAGTLLALVAALQPRQMPAVACAASLAFLAHGAYDVPLRGLAAVAAGQLLLLTAGDARAMWKALEDEATLTSRR